MPTYAGSTKFQISAQIPLLSSLPFPAVFSSQSFAPGQMISIGATAYATSGGYPYSLPTSITLIPQTIDGVVNGISTQGVYTVYAVQLTSYDPIVQMNIAGSVNSTSVSKPNLVNVYVNSSTALKNSAPLGLGGTFRFGGLLFDDAGVFRMVSDQVNDGVTQ